MTQEEWDRRRSIIKANRDKFMREYDLDHTVCPKCGHEGHSSTYVAYDIPVFNADLEMTNKDTYRDLNRVVCGRCGWTGVTHDLVRR